VPESPIQQIVCCMGQPVAGNPTQFMMERAFAAAALDWRYLTLEIPPQCLAHAMLGMRAMGFRGGDIAPPHKVEVVQYLDEITDSAKLTGSVSCVTHAGQRLIGDNTDGKGFLHALRSIANPAGCKVVVLGAGGTARATVIELGRSGVREIVIVNRTASHGQELVDLLGEKGDAKSRLVHLSGEYSIEPDTDVVINATPIGESDLDEIVPLDTKSLLPEMLVADLVRNPLRTRLLREAEDRGCKTLDGLGVLVHQGMIGFKIWTGVDPDPSVMQEALEEYLEI
jgi:shikimate dehydrogenase